MQSNISEAPYGEEKDGQLAPRFGPVSKIDLARDWFGNGAAAVVLSLACHTVRQFSFGPMRAAPEPSSVVRSGSCTFPPALQIPRRSCRLCFSVSKYMI